MLELPEPLVDAVFCFNDLPAVGALRAAARRGVDVPGQLAVVGFDDAEKSSPLATDHGRAGQGAIARTSMELLHQRITAARR